MSVFRAFAACLLLLSTAAMATAQDRPRVVAVNYALQYLTERLVGSDAEVVFPVPAEVDPSFWRPSIADISMIQSADLIVLNGAGFATWVDRVSLPRAKLVNTAAAIKDQFIVTESITHSHGDGGEHSHEGLASYTWLDLSLAAAQAEAIAAALKRVKGIAASDIDARLADLRGDLDALDQMVQRDLAESAGIAVVATHPRYQYFARRYGLSIAALEWEAGAMPSEEERADLQSLVAQTGARILIWEGPPPEAALEVSAALGLESVMFGPLAHQTGTLDFLAAFAEAAGNLSAAMGRVKGE